MPWQWSLRLFTNSSNWIHSLGLLFRKYVFNSEWWNATFRIPVSSMPGAHKNGRTQGDPCLHGSTREWRQVLATRENRMWDIPFAFSGEQGVLLIGSKSPLFLTSLLQIPLHRTFQATLQGIWRDPKPPAQPQGSKCWSKWNLAAKSEQLEGDQSSREKKS